MTRRNLKKRLSTLTARKYVATLAQLPKAKTIENYSQAVKELVMQ